jgi:hypothetical protein
LSYDILSSDTEIYYMKFKTLSIYKLNKIMVLKYITWNLRFILLKNFEFISNLIDKIIKIIIVIYQVITPQIWIFTPIIKLGDDKAIRPRTQFFLLHEISLIINSNNLAPRLKFSHILLTKKIAAWKHQHRAGDSWHGCGLQLLTILGQLLLQVVLISVYGCTCMFMYLGAGFSWTHNLSLRRVLMSLI